MMNNISEQNKKNMKLGKVFQCLRLGLFAVMLFLSAAAIAVQYTANSREELDAVCLEESIQDGICTENGCLPAPRQGEVLMRNKLFDYKADLSGGISVPSLRINGRLSPAGKNAAAVGAAMPTAYIQNGRSSAGRLLAVPTVYNDTYTKVPVTELNDMLGEYAIVCLETGSNKKVGSMQAEINSAGRVVRKTMTASGNQLLGSDATLWTITRSGRQGSNVTLKSGNNYLRMIPDSANPTSSSGATFELVTNSRNATAFTVTINQDGSFTLNYQTTSDGTTVNHYLNSSGGSDAFISYSGGDPLWIYSKDSSSQNSVIVWLDGTDGGLMNLYGSPNVNYSDHLTPGAGGTYTLVLPTEWDSPSKYDYKLFGWFDVYNQKYYSPGETVTLSGSTVFYADWRAASYDVGEENDDVMPDIDTSSFIRTYVFDYSVLFNVMSTSVSGSISGASHSESWTAQQTGTNEYTGESTLDYLFLDYDSDGQISYPRNRDTKNANHGPITPNIPSDIYNLSGKDILTLLFDESSSHDPAADSGVVGVSYIGTGDFLYHYMDENTGNYDGEHNGYYYYDSTLNAASYNQTDERFYVYNYLERTSDSKKDGGAGEYSDFLPFNSPYVNNNDHTVVNYEYNGTTNYQFDAKANGQQSAYEDAITNYFFGFRSEIDFFLPNQSGYIDGEGNYGNQSTKGEDVKFEFSGDDDVFVFVDDELVLDIGGMHGVRSGNINFSTGEVTVYNSATDGDVTITTKEFDAGEHTLTIYYMERGSSQSNCMIYFNLPPRYSLNLSKVDAKTSAPLDGAEFEVFTDINCTEPAVLWASESQYRQAYETGGEDGAAAASSNILTVADGNASCWGLVAGQTYYLKETVRPDGPYANANDLVSVTLNANGEIESIAYVIDEDGNGENDLAVPLYELNEQDVTLYLTISNMPAEDTSVYVEKLWSDGAASMTHTPVTVHLYRNNQDTGLTRTLSEANLWQAVFDELPKVDDHGNEYTYRVVEDSVPAYSTSYGTVTYVPAVPAETVTTWEQVTLTNGTHGLTPGVYRFVSGERSLGINNDNALQGQNISVVNENQQWTVAAASGVTNGFTLTNVGNPDVKMTFTTTSGGGGGGGGGGGTTYTVGTSDTSGSAFVMDGKRIRLGSNNSYVNMRNSISASTTGTEFTVYRKVTTTTEGVPAYYTVAITNTFTGGARMPDTGGTGIRELYALGINLMSTVVLAFAVLLVKRRRAVLGYLH